MFKTICKINRLLQSIVYLSLSHISLSFAQTYNLGTNLLKLTTLSDSVSKINSPEKPYLQFDKPYYAQGDTIWFKA